MASKLREKWGDLGVRVTTGVALGLVGLAAIAAGPRVFSVLVLVCGCIMIGELAVMLRAGLERKRDWGIAIGYGALIILGSQGLVALALDGGRAELVFYIGLVVVTDVMGYFVGRAVGGPKFWPSLSPKKTWSGAIGGWVGAAVLAVLCHGGLAAVTMPLMVFVALSVAISFASQMGDIAESAIKRHAGVKDASNILPGHGGVMDRFDGLVGVGALYYLLHLIDGVL
ncbi:Phosphatidate cytidylyltransferase [Aquimixticola soesokkakensis]|uniref:Phosphatidate cytidylyltransferase n=1 Tax=Aquimixticola soesokkakensis TaxID=1519096 RepID=A0A1Y5SGW6_9RHOB|nr:phosphatidate cytidylyltransferase [Aquimixticola soesokkakensis]SLN39842.1 Phosphatidate cytidylyltransferase [Aquimixticola soesokkakensis]